MELTVTQVDAFTAKPFSGNPAAVCLLPAPRDHGWMPAVAREKNLSETAFLIRENEGYSLRWFTPTVEVELCGHATLASAHVLCEQGQLKAEEVALFHTIGGRLTASIKGEWIEMSFPALPEEAADPPPQLGRALGVPMQYVGKTRFDWLVEVESEETLRGMKPDFGLLRELGVRGVMVTSRAAGTRFDFVSRFFAPGAGIDEDPVTGSAHCCLGPYWSKRLHRGEFIAYQASARGGVVRARLEGERVILGGQAVTVMRGELLQG
jgi:PhzF family phenazine biosynthesis protein